MNLCSLPDLAIIHIFECSEEKEELMDVIFLSDTSLATAGRGGEIGRGAKDGRLERSDSKSITPPFYIPNNLPLVASLITGAIYIYDWVSLTCVKTLYATVETTCCLSSSTTCCLLPIEEDGNVWLVAGGYQGIRLWPLPWMERKKVRLDGRLEPLTTLLTSIATLASLAP